MEVSSKPSEASHSQRRFFKPLLFVIGGVGLIGFNIATIQALQVNPLGFEPWSTGRLMTLSGILLGVPLVGAGLALIMLRGGAVLAPAVACLLLLFFALAFQFAQDVSEEITHPGITPKEVQQLRLRR
ncbi:MAG: hypothetical protein AAF916_07525 [Planctomycetota bacterium]